MRSISVDHGSAKIKGCASAAIARRVSIGSRAVFCACACLHKRRGKPTGCDRSKEWLCGLLCHGFSVGQKHTTAATDEAAKRWQTMTGTVRNEPAWRGFFVAAAGEETF